jgi:hypothetical protein
MRRPGQKGAQQVQHRTVPRVSSKDSLVDATRVRDFSGTMGCNPLAQKVAHLARHVTNG